MHVNVLVPAGYMIEMKVHKCLQSFKLESAFIWCSTDVQGIQSVNLGAC